MIRCLRAERPREWQDARLYVLADEHIGDPLARDDITRAKIDRILSDDRALVIVNGDMMNTAVRTGPSDVYGERMTPGRQIEYATRLLEPIRDKIVMGTTGNHEHRVYRDTGIDTTAVVFGNLGLSSLYVREGGLLYIRFGQRGGETHGRDAPPKVWYSIYATHGSGGGRKEGAKAIRLADMAATVDADIYIHSHTHMPMIMRQAFFRADPYNCAATRADRLFVNSGSALGYGGYGQAQEYKPSSTRTPVITLDGRRKDASATL